MSRRIVSPTAGITNSRIQKFTVKMKPRGFLHPRQNINVTLQSLTTYRLEEVMSIAVLSCP
ncbi:Amine oxidase [Psidium guajava]|nr:Amine oxidase [Psidium guajava]